MMTFRKYMTDLEISTVSEKDLIPSWITDPCWVLKVKWAFGGHPGHVWVGFPQM